MLHRLAPALLATAALLGCDTAEDIDSNPDAWEFPGHAGKEDDVGDGLIPTGSTTARVFDGFNLVADSTVGAHCVVPRTGAVEFAPYRAGTDVVEETISYIESLEELHEALEINAQAQVEVGPIGGGAGVGFSEEFKSSDTSLSILLRSRHRYTVINQDQHALTDDALALAQSDPEAFTQQCGTHYVAGVEYGADLAILIQIETQSLSQKEEITASLKADGIQAGAATIGAEVGSKFAESLSQEGVTVTARTRIRGFDSSVSLAAIEANPLDPSAMALVEKANADLRASVKNDKCHDQGDAGPGTCDGRPALGYLDNGSRTARPVGVHLQSYRLATNFPRDGATVDAFIEQRQRAERGMAFVGQHAALMNKVIGVYNEEIGAILESSTPYKFAIHDTDEVFLHVDTAELLDRAVNLAELFDPEDGTAADLLSRSLSACWERAQFGDLSDCQDPVSASVEYETVLAALEGYEKQRIRPVYYTVLPETEEYDEAAELCPEGTRLPNKYEATRLLSARKVDPDVPAPKHLGDNVSEDWPLWVSDPYGDCAEDEGGYVDFDETDVFFDCYDNPWLETDMELPVFCVPTEGVYGSSVPTL